MKPESIFVPMSLLALWTLLVLLLVGLRRVIGTQRGQIPPGAFKAGPGANIPLRVEIANRNFMNLLEAPVLFYVLGLALYVTHHLTPHLLTLAWVYVVFRFLHSLIHLGPNKIIPRLVAFAASNFVLTAMWATFLVAILRRA